MLQGAGAKAGLLLKFDQLSSGDESLIGSTEIGRSRDRGEIVTGPDRRIAGKVIYEARSGAARKSW